MSIFLGSLVDQQSAARELVNKNHFAQRKTEFCFCSAGKPHPGGKAET
jgi:hypothetical protein